MVSPSLRPRFLPISWRFLKERDSMYFSMRSPSPDKGLSRLDRTTANQYLRVSPLPHPNTKSKGRDAIAAAHHSFQRRLSHARNIYHRLHNSTDQSYQSNTAVLRSLPITSLYKHHLATLHKRVPTALKDTCS